MANGDSEDFITGLMYHLINDAPQNFDEALRVAQSGGSIEEFGNVQYNLGVMYHKGIGVTKNYAEARQWYGRASQSGNLKAENNIGVMHEKGQGASDMRGETENFYRNAATRGNKFAQYNLGALYYRYAIKGQSVPMNLYESYVWVSIAVARGVYIGNKILELIESKMASTDLAGAQDYAKNSWEANRESWEKEE